ncbi:hypothetical protein [Ktedonospora formicarum]|uniref:Uncharacterized protein n=1 Tax=Ktedonospora formicarum TaxID=2778364 RepID=A0A8J3ICB3_9CHLR|nr:hypothetical protein [Ktedonospora formicarum]GHO49668.1 hypothetical protein KSX_78310 [Ktedonospora formicarum]
MTIDEYQSQLTSIIEEEIHSGEKYNQDERRAYLWTQAEDVWKKLEDQREKDKQEKDRLSTMQLSQAEAEKLRPFTEYIQKILDEDLPEMRANSRRA